MQLQTFIFFGASGSGKGTQAKLLIEKFNVLDSGKRVLYLETGEKLREFVKEASLASKLAKEVLDTGGLMPEFIPIWVWTEFLIRHVSGEEHLIFDGSPRKLDEAAILDSALQFYKREKPFVISIEVSDAWAKKRMNERKRNDDNEAEIMQRLSWYKENVLPAINFFKNNSYYKFVSINGEQSIEEVHQEILKKIEIQPHP